MAVNHQYEAFTGVYSGATELTHVPTWVPDINPNGTHEPITVVRRGSLVSISGLMVVHPNVVPVDTVLTTLPEDFRPDKVVVFDATTQNSLGNGTRVIININSDGEVINDDLSLGGYLYFNATYHVAVN